VTKEKVDKIISLLEELRNNEKPFIKRIAEEALRKICHDKTIEDIHRQALEKFPQHIRNLLAEEDERFTEEFRSMAGGDKYGVLLEALYESDSFLARKTLLEALPAADTAKYWNSIKSLYKRAEYRMDAEVFGLLAWKIETEKPGRANYVYEKVPGKKYGRYKRVSKFGRHTKYHMMRRTWRYFRNIAKKHPDLYARFAYFFLKNFKDSQAQKPHKTVKHRYNWTTRERFTTVRNYDRFTHLWTFNHILYKKSRRYTKSVLTWRCAEGYEPNDSEPEEREEAFTDLWEKDSLPAFNLLLESDCREVSSFAVKILRDKFPEVFRELLTAEDIKKLLEKPFPFVCNTLLSMMDKNFNPEKSDMELIKILFASSSLSARELAKKWTGQIIYTVHEKKKLLSMLFSSPYSDNRVFALELIREFCRKDPSLKEEYLKYFISILLKDEPGEGLHKIIIEKLKSDFSPELINLSPEEIFRMLNSSSVAVQDLGGWLLLKGRIDPWKLESKVITGFATHELMSVREAGRKMIEETKSRWKDEIFHLFKLLESNWEDTEEFAFKFLDENFSPGDFTVDICFYLCDSNKKAVQDFGKKKMKDYIEKGEKADFIRLAEHPDMNIQEFALDVVMAGLPREGEKIKGLMPFFRTILFRVNRGRKMKDKLFLYLKTAAMENAFVAAEIMGLLEDYSGTVTGGDFSVCLEIMTGVKSRYPYVKSSVEILD